MEERMKEREEILLKLKEGRRFFLDLGSYGMGWPGQVEWARKHYSGVQFQIFEKEIWIPEQPRQSEGPLERVIYGPAVISGADHIILEGVILKPGESTIVTKYCHDMCNCPFPRKREVLVKNQDGKLIEDWTIIQKEKNRAFAKQQAEVLKNLGITEEDVRKIFKAAGPGAAVRAVKYGQKLLERFKDPEEQDLLLVILNQKGPAETQLGLRRALTVLKKVGAPPPDDIGVNTFNSRDWFRVLQGARKYIHLYSGSGTQK